MTKAERPDYVLRRQRETVDMFDALGGDIAKRMPHTGKLNTSFILSGGTDGSICWYQNPEVEEDETGEFKVLGTLLVESFMGRLSAVERIHTFYRNLGATSTKLGLAGIDVVNRRRGSDAIVNIIPVLEPNDFELIQDNLDRIRGVLVPNSLS